MNLLRDFSLLSLWRSLFPHRRTARAVYTVTVPAPLAAAEVIELRRPVVVAQSAPLPRVVNG
ncbi:hypothetical protein [Fulvimonas yonginensis]|uniref:Uncharacterized protein n=1 Tax=Fulvimonas yonginensis TaxID=1495200 RepID=A0ABU8JC36_9GAMM